MNFNTCIVMILTICSLTTVAGENLLPNPSFEEGDKKPLHWVVWGGKKSEAKYSSKQAKSGKKSLSISAAAGKSGCRWIIEEGIKVIPGVEYELSGWIKTLNAKGNCSISISWYSKKGWFMSKRSLLINKTHDWRLLTLREKAPAKAIYAKIYVGKIRAGVGDCWFDDLCFKQLSKVKKVESKGAKISWPLKIEEKVTVTFPENRHPGQAIDQWRAMNAQECLSLKSNSGILSIKDTFGNFTGWISHEYKVEPGKVYNLQANVCRYKSYNVYMGILWSNAKQKNIGVSLGKVQTTLQKWQNAAISAKAPNAGKQAQFIFIQRRSGGETQIQEPITY